MAETFKEIRQIEKDAEGIISAAEAKKEHIISTARKDAEKHFSEESEALKKHIEEETAKAGSEAEAARQKVINSNRKKIDALRQIAGANKEKVVQEVLKKFERLFE